ncbi:hypothetical protein [Curtobacterium sp. MCBD17_040]|uniref:hypothetical protein n=1 Tax=Curtobacterium sp. MCBD17_040 TaxID=2175674 RepID=UPI0011B7CF5C|nr:hypothetical protein [Curtobacterium sp. MCBD17_040]WIB65512.1 hypothetical protein DEI94_19250 [Curtobacterium sp. MCBD17_040]
METTDDVTRLATLLEDPNRDMPVVVLSTPAGDVQPRFLMDQVVRDLGGNSFISVIPTGPLTFRLGDRLGEDFTVYGGAARVYPPGTDWLHDRTAAPIVFAYADSDRRHITDTLTRRVVEATAAAAPPAYEATVTSSAGASTQTLTVDGPDWDTIMSAVTEQHEQRQQQPPPQESQPAPRTRKDLIAEVATLTARIATLEQDNQRLNAIQTGNTNRTLRNTITSLEKQLAAAQQQLRDADLTRARVEAKLAVALETVRETGRRYARAAKKGGNAVSTTSCPIPIDQFPTADAAARHAILLAWVDRVPATEKTERPLPDYDVLPGFVDSFTDLTDTQTSKALRCVVDILTGRENLPARRVHPLRTSDAGNAPAHVRADGAVCFRANIETNTASARRLHYWKRGDGRIELIRIDVRTLTGVR